MTDAEDTATKMEKYRHRNWILPVAFYAAVAAFATFRRKLGL